MAFSQKDTADKMKEAPSTKESLGRVLEQKGTSEKSNVAKPVTEAVQGEVADVMAGMEGPKEKVSEKAKERGSENKATTAGAKGDDGKQAALLQQLKTQALPDPEVMIERIRVKIKGQIVQEIKKANRLIGKLDQGSAQEYNNSIARIRQLSHTLYQLLTATYDLIKDLYLRFFKVSEK